MSGATAERRAAPVRAQPRRRKAAQYRGILDLLGPTCHRIAETEVHLDADARRAGKSEKAGALPGVLFRTPDLLDDEFRQVETQAVLGTRHGIHLAAQIDLSSSAARRRRDGSISSTREISAMVVLRCRRASCGASIPASGPTSRSNRKQSTMVRAGFVMRAGTSSNSTGFTPKVHAGPLKRTMRSRSSRRRGMRALCGMASQTSAGACVPISCTRSAVSRHTTLFGTRAQA